VEDGSVGEAEQPSHRNRNLPRPFPLETRDRGWDYYAGPSPSPSPSPSYLSRDPFAAMSGPSSGGRGIRTESFSPSGNARANYEASRNYYPSAAVSPSNPSHYLSDFFEGATDPGPVPSNPPHYLSEWLEGAPDPGAGAGAGWSDWHDSRDAAEAAAASEGSFWGDAARLAVRHGVPYGIGDWLVDRWGSGWGSGSDSDSDPIKPPSWFPGGETSTHHSPIDLLAQTSRPEMLVGPEDNSNRLDTARSAALHDFGGATGEELARLQAIDRFGYVPDDQGNPERFDPGYHRATGPIGDLFPVGPGEELPPVDVRVPTNYPMRRIS